MEKYKHIKLEDLPKDWSVGFFKDLATYNLGRTPTRNIKKFWDDGVYPWVSIADMFPYGIILGTKEKVSEIAHNELFRKRLVPAGTLLMSFKLTIGRVSKLGISAYHNEAIISIYIKNKDVVFDDYLFYYLSQIDYSNYHDTAVKGKTLNKGKIDKLEIALPPLDEQHRIAHVLTTVQTAIEQQAKLIDLTRELKSTLMGKLFTEGLRGEKQKEIENRFVPANWKQLRLEETGDVIYGIQAAVANNLLPIGMKILTNKNITLDGQIVLDEINYFELKTKRHFDSVLQKGDILFNWRSGSKEHIGKTAYFNLDGEYTHSSFILRIRPNESVSGRFLFWYLFYLRESGYFLQKHDISSVNATFNKSAVDALSVFLPLKDEQEEIASILDAVDSKIMLLKRRQDVQEELFRTLLHQLMTGQVRVKDLDI
ncbi:MAG TPA: hypothetical protein DIW27_06645 [Cytophagales bacterium]|mgnify:CR=1 FL=1|nr:hypothetical protein [Cytophagales bacterium]HRJ55155.1 restriction endonuclease subunit S [Anaerolineales bacterium]